MTEQYRGYVIKPSRSLIAYEISYDGKGSLHNSLKGSFTSKKVARGFIDDYLRGKEEVDGETSASSGSEQVHRRANNRREPANNAG